MALSIQTILIGKYQYRLDKAGIPGDHKGKNSRPAPKSRYQGMGINK